MLNTSFTGISMAALVALAGPAFGQDYSQAPDLKAAVEAGTLAPVQDRLPAKPMVARRLTERCILIFVKISKLLGSSKQILSPCILETTVPQTSPVH